MRNSVIHSITILLLFTSCSNKQLSPEAYIRWINKNKGLVSCSKEIEGIIFDVQYQPAEFMVLHEFKQHETINPELFRKRLAERKDMERYVINISLATKDYYILKYELKGPSDYSERINYYSFRVDKDLYLIREDDTVSCLIHHFERSYGVTPGITITAGFPAAERERITERTLVLQDRVFNRGRVNIKLKDLHKIPSIRL